jgi:hypothetical protein
VSVTAPTGGAAPTGTLSFKSGSTVLSTGNLTAQPDGTSTATASASLPTGKYNVKAVYAGSSAYSVSSSATTVMLTVQ